MKRIALSLAGSAAIAVTGFGGLAIAPAQVQADIITKGAVTASGTFVTVDQGHPTTGSAQIIEENGQNYLELSNSFSTATGPAVYVVLHRNSSVDARLNEQDYVTLAPLQSFNGSQRYAIPDTVDVNAFNSVAIWCQQFNVTFGYAAL